MNPEHPSQPVLAELSEEEIVRCTALLEQMVRDPALLASLTHPQRVALLTAAGRLSRPQKQEMSLRSRELRKVKKQRFAGLERGARASTGIRSARQARVFSPPERQALAAPDFQEFRGELNSPRNCYICKAEYKQLHFFYDALCPSCARFNYDKRFQSAPLHGQVALITGSRLKIGYQAALMLLRAGARVIATTRFPVDSALRYAREKDFAEWKDRLDIYGLDLRHTPSVELFCRYVSQKYSRLDLLINNAAQTVRRPPGFYAHLMAGERQRAEDLPEEARQLLAAYENCRQQLKAHVPESRALEGIAEASALAVAWNSRAPGVGLRASAELSQIPYAYDGALAAEKVFPAGELDADLQQVDLRSTNSWRLYLGEVETSELLEIQLVNAIAPFVLCNKLVPLMKRHPTGCKHIVNVTAMEGKFLRFKKASRHPHTNMAKAALNMLTHTASADLSKHGIFINAVDTGWVTDEDPAQLAARKQAMHDFQPPLDIVDGAARVCDPFFHGILSGSHWSGQFLKDYFPIDW